MKNWVKCLLLVLMIVPFSFLAVACRDKEPKYDKEANVQALNKAVESYKNIGNNYTILTSAISSGNFNDYKDMVPNCTLNFDGDNVKVVTSENVSYLIDDIYYSRDYELGQWSGFHVTETDMSNLSSSIESSDFVEDMNFTQLQEFAFTLNERAITTEITDSSTTVTLNLNMDALLNNIKTKMLENRAYTMEELINSILKDLGKDTSVQQWIQDAKNSVTAETTVGEFVARFESYTGLDLIEMMNSIIQEMDLEQSNATYVYTPNISFIEKSIEGLEGLDFDDIKDTKLNEFLTDFEIESFAQFMDDIYAQLRDSSVTTFVENYCLEEGETAEQYFNDLQSSALNQFDINIILRTDNNNNFVSSAVEVVYEAVIVEKGIPGFEMGNLKITSTYSNVGTTSVELSENAQIADVTITLKNQKVEAGKDLTIEKVAFPYAKTFFVMDKDENVVVEYDSEEKVLMISSLVVDEFVEQNNSDTKSYNVLSISQSVDGVKFNINIEID